MKVTKIDEFDDGSALCTLGFSEQEMTTIVGYFVTQALSQLNKEFHATGVQIERTSGGRKKQRHGHKNGAKNTAEAVRGVEKGHAKATGAAIAKTRR